MLDSLRVHAKPLLSSPLKTRPPKASALTVSSLWQKRRPAKEAGKIGPLPRLDNRGARVKTELIPFGRPML
jgi:hypothetical protein